MAAANGPFPELLRELPDAPSPAEFSRMSDRERVHAVGTTLLAVHQAWPALVDTLDRHNAGILEANATGARTERKVDDALKLLRVATLPVALPPMRPESPSSLDALAVAKTEISREFEREARQSGGPPQIVQSSPDRLTSIAEGVFVKMLAARELAARQKADADRLAAYDAEQERIRLEAVAKKAQRAKDRRKVVMAVLLAAATVLGTNLTTRALSKAEAKAEAAKVVAAQTAAAASAPVPGPTAPR